MHKILLDNNYRPPYLQPYNQDGLRVEFSEDKFYARLFIDDKLFMVYDYINHNQALEMLSHYYLAKGHCICTGLGFAVRENWIATKKEVTKITVIEKNKNLIDYHKKIGTKFSPKIEIIHEDANQYKGKCDTLLLDHYEFIDPRKFFPQIKQVTKNIEHTTLWFWLLEEKLFMEYNFGLDFIFKYYDLLRTELRTLPILSKELLHLFISPIPKYRF
tara:strand:- start:340 stop:987 length:648 start_codon:yes stop_codon:yes gene_type:complete